MKNDSKAIDQLKQIYRLYDRYVASLDLACQKYCADCCTTNLTMTGLEGRLIVESIAAEQYQDLSDRIAANLSAPRYQPKMTTNGYARICMEQTHPPEDDAPAESAACPLLQDDACTIYFLRPFGCRCMVSSAPCRPLGQADIDEFTLTVNTVFLQCIEHLDADGCFGNLTDVLAASMMPDNPVDGPVRTVSNQRLPALMVPPAHREKIGFLISELNAIFSRG